MSILRSILLAASLVILANAVPLLKNVDVPRHTELARDNPEIDYRLPKNVKPTAYTIKLTPNIVPEAFTFAGESTINITVSAITKQIKLHAKDLDIVEESTKLIDAKNSTIIFAPAKQKIDELTDFLTLDFDKDISVGDYVLSLRYNGILNDELNGFYRSSYINEKDEQVWLATTKFEPTYARRAFPCFDEPAMKATFQISISHDDKYDVHSNSLMESITPDPSNLAKVVTTFKVTPIMSTYLVAFVVSDFESLTSPDGRFRVWSRRNAIQTGKYAHDIGQKELRLLENYTRINEAMEKMDNFAIPQFPSGAMENWGIVTYRESSLLFDESVSTTSSKQSIATVISHEFAHQWFGNLVSPAWWQYTWLNEGFANYFQYHITNEVEPKWRLMDQFVIVNLQAGAFLADDNENQHSMNVEVGSPSEIKAIFDTISYGKAGCVIRMFSHALTKEIFQKGLNLYLNTMAYKVATSDDLFKALVETATAVAKEVDLKAALNSWAGQAGFPVLTVTLDPKAGTARVIQKRFLTKKPTTARTEKWLIPITYATQEGLRFNDTKPDTWLTAAANQTINVTGLKENQWVIFNKQQTGYYRVNYDKTNWQLIAAYIHTDNYTNIDVLNRAQLLDDSFNLARAGELDDYTIFLEISRYLEHEIDYVPWFAAFRAFDFLNRALVTTANYDLFKLYILKLTAKLERSVGYTDVDEDEHVTKFNRNNVVKWACLMGSETCRDEAHEKLVDDITGVSKISADLRGAIFCGGMRKANASIWETAFKIYENTEDGTQRNAILNSLGCSSDTKILESYLAKAIEPNSSVSVGTALMMINVGSESGINVAFDFVNEKYKEIYAIDNGTDTIVYCVNEIAARMTTQDQVDKLNKFIEVHEDIADILRGNALVRATSNVEWVKKNEMHIETFLKAQNLADAPKTI